MKEQYQNHVLFVTEGDIKKYLRFDFAIVLSRTLPKEVVIGDADDESFAVVSKRDIAYVTQIENATVLNNTTEMTKHIHGVYASELEHLNGYLSVEVI